MLGLTNLIGKSVSHITEADFRTARQKLKLTAIPACILTSVTSRSIISNQ